MDFLGDMIETSKMGEEFGLRPLKFGLGFPVQGVWGSSLFEGSGVLRVWGLRAKGL